VGTIRKLTKKEGSAQSDASTTRRAAVVTKGCSEKIGKAKGGWDRKAGNQKEDLLQEAMEITGIRCLA